MRDLFVLVVAGALAALPGAGSGEGSVTGPVVPAVEAPQDTVVAARPGDVFDVETLRGTLIVRTGDDGVRLRGDDEGAVLVRDGERIRLRPGRGAGDQDVVVELPPWMPVSIRSRELDVSITDREAEVRVEVLSGDVRIEKVVGPVEVRTLNGEVEVRGTEGDLGVFTADGDVRVEDHRGGVQVESTDGDLALRGVEGRTVGASTLDGDVEFDGTVGEDGFLDLSTHDGDVTAALPAALHAEVEVSTFHGSFSSDFTVRTGGFRAGEPLRFRIGNGGGARISLRSFDGDVHILSR